MRFLNAQYGWDTRFPPGEEGLARERDNLAMSSAQSLGASVGFGGTQGLLTAALPGSMGGLAGLDPHNPEEHDYSSAYTRPSGAAVDDGGVSWENYNRYWQYECHLLGTARGTSTTRENDELPSLVVPGDYGSTTQHLRALHDEAVQQHNAANAMAAAAHREEEARQHDAAQTGQHPAPSAFSMFIDAWADNAAETRAARQGQHANAPPTPAQQTAAAHKTLREQNINTKKERLEDYINEKRRASGGPVPVMPRSLHDTHGDGHSVSHLPFVFIARFFAKSPLRLSGCCFAGCRLCGASRGCACAECCAFPLPFGVPPDARACHDGSRAVLV